MPTTVTATSVVDGARRAAGAAAAAEEGRGCEEIAIDGAWELSWLALTLFGDAAGVEGAKEGDAFC